MKLTFLITFGPCSKHCLQHDESCVNKINYKESPYELYKGIKHDIFTSACSYMQIFVPNNKMDGLENFDTKADEVTIFRKFHFY